jgi:hypothetical protein
MYERKPKYGGDVTQQLTERSGNARSDARQSPTMTDATQFS